jgi:hypothetical protein
MPGVILSGDDFPVSPGRRLSGRVLRLAEADERSLGPAQPPVPEGLFVRTAEKRPFFIVSVR